MLQVRKVGLNSLCKSLGNTLIHKLCKETFSTTCYLSDYVADVVGGMCYEQVSKVSPLGLVALFPVQLCSVDKGKLLQQRGASTVVLSIWGA